jgi:hypothetical protein
MADEKKKVFIGKVTEKIFETGGSIIKLSLNRKDQDLIKSIGGDFINIEIKKSYSGVWYAEIDQFKPAAR